MQFLSNWTINVTKILTYVEFHQDFVENIDYDLANIILEEKDELIANESMAYFSNLVACIRHEKADLGEDTQTVQRLHILMDDLTQNSGSIILD